MNENKEYIVHPDEMGSIHISEDVLAAIAANAAAEVEGVSGLLTVPGTKRSAAKGVRLALKGEETVIDLFLMVKYGQPIPEVAERVQSAVAGAVEAMAGLTAAAVNVHVGGVAF